MTRYLFIDGAYLTKVYKDLMQEFWKIDGEIDFIALTGGTGTYAKVLYYDCIDHAPRKDETPEQRDDRVHAKEAFLDRIRESPRARMSDARPRSETPR